MAHDRQEAFRSECPGSGHSKDRRIHPTGIAEYHTAERVQVRVEGLDVYQGLDVYHRGNVITFLMPHDNALEINPELSIPLTELEYRASRSGGPGGQHVNTSSTRIEVWWDVTGSPSLTEEQRARLLQRLAARIDGSGHLRLVSSGSRSQLRNREEVTDRLRTVLGAALTVRKPRKRTKPSRAAKAARLEAKRRRALTKQRRRGPSPDE
jgi:ribosome-associated protein